IICQGKKERNHKCEFAPPPSLCLTSPQLPYLQPFTALPPNPLSESLGNWVRLRMGGVWMNPFIEKPG
ncbi:MAG: hypothetical protein Q8Q12_18230, partial [bacterium]|nr:hypothetical protein [bacterium]